MLDVVVKCFCSYQGRQGRCSITFGKEVSNSFGQGTDLPQEKESWWKWKPRHVVSAEAWSP